MVQAGVFQSVKPDAETPQWVQDYESEVDRAIAALKNWVWWRRRRIPTDYLLNSIEETELLNYYKDIYKYTIKNLNFLFIIFFCMSLFYWLFRLETYLTEHI